MEMNDFLEDLEEVLDCMSKPSRRARVITQVPVYAYHSSSLIPT